MKKIPIRQLSPARQELHSQGQFKIRKVEDILQGNDVSHELHRHDFFFILALQYGNGNHEIDFTSYKIQDNAVFFLRPGQVHQLELKADCTGYLAEFDMAFYQPKGKLASQRLRRASNKNHCELEKHRFVKLHATLASMFDEYMAKEEGYQEIIQSNLDIFFIEFIRQSQNTKGKENNPNPYSQERFEEFLEHLNTHLTNRKQVSQYTALMNLSAYQLNEITRSSIGKNASELINDYIILEAKRYLLATPNQVKDIADHLGYEDASYFIRFFKKHTGHSPEAFRQRSK